MEAVKAPRGTRDILGDESWKWAYVTQMCRDVADDYGYKEVYLPIFEHTELFCRGVGETTDVVEKEMYTFTDKGGRSITLRPELTASMVRSYLENEMNKGAQPAKLWSIGPMFRYERPQKGRYRQFVQLDIEALGAQDAFVDLEVIDFSTGTFGYIAFAFTVAVSAAALLLARKAKRAAKEDSPISPEEEDRDTPVSVPPELPEESGASAPTLPVPEHGEKRRAREDKGGGDA